MKDQFGRTIDYMRISITDRCNLRCRYCMPERIEWLPKEELLSLEEIAEICRLASSLGIRKIKITGGEPLVRNGCDRLIGMISQIPGIDQVSLTTNGILLADYAESLRRQGLHAVNVSLDALDPDIYAQITGYHKLPQVLDGLHAMEQQQIPTKINVVLQRGVNDTECLALAELARHHAFDVRFIELMPIGHGKQLTCVSNTEVFQKLSDHYGTLLPDPDTHGNGPARYYTVKGFQRSIGFISAIHGKFCNSCNRIRLTATGDLKPCLCYQERISVKDALRSGDTKAAQNYWLRLFFKNLPPIALRLFPPSLKTPKCHALAADTIQLSQYHHIRRIHMQPQALLWMFFFTKRPPEFFCCLHTDPVKMISAAFFRLLCMLRHHHDYH